MSLVLTTSKQPYKITSLLELYSEVAASVIVFILQLRRGGVTDPSYHLTAKDETSTCTDDFNDFQSKNRRKCTRVFIEENETLSKDK